MEFSNSFVMPTATDEALAVLADLERIAPCMPGARLEGVEDDVYTGRVTVKVGPMNLSYRGTARLVELDPESHTVRIVAKGNEARGGGTASADVTAVLADAGDDTKVTVTTQINLTGRAAQFGRGVLADIGASIVDQFAANLEAQLAPPPATTDGTGRASGAQPISAVEVERGDAEPLDMTDLAGRVVRERAMPLLVGLITLVWLVRRLRRR